LIPRATLSQRKTLNHFLARHRDDVILDVGSGQRRLAPQVLNVDVSLHSETDIVADIRNLPVSDETFAATICQGVLEHVKDPERAVREIHRVLRPGGELFVEVPFLQPFHADPDDFQRYTSRGVEVLLHDFRVIEHGASSGAFSAVAFVIRELPELFLFQAPPWFRRFAKVPFALLGGLVRFGDLVIVNAPGAERVAASLYVVAKKD
jgi:SAM-dependent methyltransferase